jgi:hypothetical protein
MSGEVRVPLPVRVTAAAPHTADAPQHGNATGNGVQRIIAARSSMILRLLPCKSTQAELREAQG